MEIDLNSQLYTFMNLSLTVTDEFYTFETFIPFCIFCTIYIEQQMKYIYDAFLEERNWKKFLRFQLTFSSISK